MATHVGIGQVIFLCFYGIEVHKNATNEQGQYPAIFTEQAWSTKDSLYRQKITPKNFAFVGTTWAIPCRKERPILPAQVVNQNTGFASSSPLTEPVIQ